MVGLNAEAFRGMKRMVEYSIFQRGTIVFIASLLILALASTYPGWIHLPLLAFGIGLG